MMELDIIKYKCIKNCGRKFVRLADLIIIVVGVEDITIHTMWMQLTGIYSS